MGGGVDRACDSPWPGSLSQVRWSLPGGGGSRKRGALFSGDSPHSAPWPGFAGGGGPVSGERRFESLISDSWISSAEAGWRGCGWRNQAGGSWDGVGKGFASVAQFGTMRLALEDCCSLLPGISSVDWHRNLLSFCSLTASCHYLKPRWSFMFVRYRANALRTYLRLMFCLISVFSSDFANIFNLFFVSFCVCQYHGRIRVILKTVLPK